MTVPASGKSTLSAVVSPLAEPEPLIAEQEVLALRRGSGRTWSVIAVLAITAVIAIVAITRSSATSEPAVASAAPVAAPIATLSAPAPRSNFNRPGFPGSSYDEPGAAHPDAAASAKGSLAPRVVPGKPAPAKSNARDYGI